MSNELLKIYYLNVPLRKWYSVINGRPGFIDEVFHALKCKVKQSKMPFLCNLVIDEIAIRKSRDYDEKRYYGHVDLGVNGEIDCNDPPRAKHALVYAFCDKWSLENAVSYFLIKSLNSKERSSLLQKC